MATFQEVDPSQAPTQRDAKRGRVYYPIVKDFLETGLFLAKLERTSVGNRAPALLYAGISQYCKAKRVPVKVLQRSGEILLMRLDILPDGSPDPEYTPPTQAELGIPVPGLDGVEEPSAPAFDEVVDDKFKDLVDDSTR